MNRSNADPTLVQRFLSLRQVFDDHFPYDAHIHGSADTSPILVRSPGRVNFIGEHTDYNDGFVLPLAIDRDILMLGRRRTDSHVRVFSMNFRQTADFHLDDVAARDEKAPWINYVRGVVGVLSHEGYDVGGFDAAILGNIPLGAGLSSSAALEVGVAVLLQHLFNLSLDPVATARLCQQAENEFVGVQCGIMDQFAVALGRQGHGLLLDCRTLDFKLVPFPTRHVSIVVADTGVRRALTDSAYNTRRAECEMGVSMLCPYLPGIRALRDVPPHEFEMYRTVLPDVIARRCSHVIYEHARVSAAADVLQDENFAACGQLMNASHVSLRDYYQVSCRELDELADIARSVPGVYGARMTGAGFGGCVIILVRTEAVPTLVQAIQEQYPRRAGRRAAVHIVRPSDGAARMM